MKKKRLLTLLVLLITAATGAWAQTIVFADATYGDAVNNRSPKVESGWELWQAGVMRSPDTDFSFNGTRIYNDLCLEGLKVGYFCNGQWPNGFMIYGNSTEDYVPKLTLPKGALTVTYHAANWKENIAREIHFQILNNSDEVLVDNVTYTSSDKNMDGNRTASYKADEFQFTFDCPETGLYKIKLGSPVGETLIGNITIAPAVAVTGVTLPATATVTLGDVVALTAAVAPADATDKKVKWTVTAGTDKVKLYKDADCKTEVGTEATDVLTVYAKGLAVGDATVKVESNADATKTATCTVTAKHGTYAVAMKAGVTDGDQWTARAGGSGDFAAMPLEGVEGGTKPVELKYAGDREVKRVTMRVLPAWKGDLSKISATELESDGVTVLVKDGMTLTGTLNGETQPYKISIEDGAEVTLDGVTINGYNHSAFLWAGLHCLGDATIILKDGTANSVTGFADEYPGIFVPTGKTLTIKGESLGTGTFSASSNGNASGIGGGFMHSCGNITIEGGIITAQGGNKAAGIGSGQGAKCGNILITGGTITATGGKQAAGIGGGNASVNPTGCRDITITDGVTRVTATKGQNAPYSIGMGQSSGSPNSCGTVTIGGTKYWENGAAVNDGATYLAQDVIEYPTPVAFAANEYNEASWDGSKVVFTKKTAASTPTAVANSNTAVTWSDGWYTVAGDVTISGNVTLTADTYLILQDGATLTINGQLEFRNNQKNLYIYGQRKGDGKLNVICSSSSAVAAIYGKTGKTVEIHGGEITAEGYSTGLAVGYLKVFSGKITATCGSYGTDCIVFSNSCDVYGGEIEATTNNFGLDSRGISDGGNGGTFTVYGGKVKGTGSGVEVPPYYGFGIKGKVKSGTAGIKFYFSDNGTDWDEGTYYGTATDAPSKKYAKAE